jgi:hypothetical protein
LTDGQFDELLDGGALQIETRAGGTISRSVLTWDVPSPPPTPSVMVNSVLQHAGHNSQLHATQNINTDVAGLRDEIIAAIKHESQQVRIDVADLLEAMIATSPQAVKKASLKNAVELVTKFPDALLKLTQLADRLGIPFPTL